MVRLIHGLNQSQISFFAKISFRRLCFSQRVLHWRSDSVKLQASARECERIREVPKKSPKKENNRRKSIFGACAKPILAKRQHKTSASPEISVNSSSVTLCAAKFLRKELFLHGPEIIGKIKTDIDRQFLICKMKKFYFSKIYWKICFIIKTQSSLLTSVFIFSDHFPNFKNRALCTVELPRMCKLKLKESQE